MSSTPHAEQEIRNALRRNRRVSEHLIDVRSSHGGRIELRGRVPSFREKLEAERIVRAKRGPRAVVNLLDVNPRRRMTDRGVAQQVRASLSAAVGVAGEAVTVDVKGGRVLLRGTAASREERRTIADIALGVPGVKRVTNFVRADARDHALDRHSAEEIQRRLEDDLQLRECYLRVAVSGDTAVLSGYASSRRQRRRAARIAREYPLLRVRNEIVITRDRATAQDRVA